MVDDGYRLSFSIDDKGFAITDTLSGKLIIYRNKTVSAFTLDRDVVLQHIKNLQEAIMSYHPLIMFRRPVALSANNTLVIREDAHFQWTAGMQGKAMSLKDNRAVTSPGFDKNVVLSRINKMYSDILSVGRVLSPKHDIVRRVSDAGLLVWVHEKHSVVCYEKDVLGSTMCNCLIDGMYFKLVFVSVSDVDNTCTLFNTQLGEIITYPLDESIKTFYKADESFFD